MKTHKERNCFLIAGERLDGCGQALALALEKHSTCQSHLRESKRLVISSERNQNECNSPTIAPRCNKIFCREPGGVLLAVGKMCGLGLWNIERRLNREHQRKPFPLSALSICHHPGGDDSTPNHFKPPQCFSLPRTTSHHLTLTGL